MCSASCLAALYLLRVCEDNEIESLLLLAAGPLCNMTPAVFKDRQSDGRLVR